MEPEGLGGWMDGWSVGVTYVCIWGTPAVESEVTRGYCGHGREFIHECLDKILEYKSKSVNIFICKNP